MGPRLPAQWLGLRLPGRWLGLRLPGRWLSLRLPARWLVVRTICSLLGRQRCYFRLYRAQHGRGFRFVCSAWPPYPGPRRWEEHTHTHTACAVSRPRLHANTQTVSLQKTAEEAQTWTHRDCLTYKLWSRLLKVTDSDWFLLISYSCITHQPFIFHSHWHSFIL